jgi:hypothetical protein
MALNFSGFKKKLFNAFKKTEGSKAYVLSFAGGNCGYSYGYVQFDLAAGPSIGKLAFYNILQNATNNIGIRIIPQNQVTSLYNAAKKRGGNTLTSTQKKLINAALSSAYGQSETDNATSKHLDNLISNANKFINKASANDQIFLNSDLGKLWICDIQNQGFLLWAVGNKQTKQSRFELFLNGAQEFGYKKQGNFGFDDLLELYFRERSINTTTTYSSLTS